MNPLTHQIGKVVLNLNFSSEKEALQVQNSFPTAFENRVKSMLDDVFNDFSANGETVVIDKIDLNLGEISLVNFDESLKKQLRQKLSETIMENQAKPGIEKVSRISSSNLPYEILLFFIEYGHLPWWAESTTLGQLEHDISTQKTAIHTEIRSRFLKIVSTENARKRITKQLSPDFQKHLFSIVYPEKAGFISQISDELNAFLKSRNVAEIQDETFWPEFVWELAAKVQEEKTFQQEFYHQFSKIISEKFNFEISEFSGKSFLEKEITENEIVKKHFDKDFTKTKEDFPPFQETKSSEKPVEIVVANAGLVVFWPFLEGFFRELRLWDGDCFFGESQHQKAVLLTQFLATGQIETEETQLPLNKLLCGWPLEKPVGRTLELTSDEISASEEFMIAVIKNWEVLKNTSVAALRETFLQRPGILTLRPEKWSLKVERKTVDILRDSLPWPVSIIKLAWMEKILYTEW